MTSVMSDTSVSDTPSDGASSTSGAHIKVSESFRAQMLDNARQVENQLLDRFLAAGVIVAPDDGVEEWREKWLTKPDTLKVSNTKRGRPAGTRRAPKRKVEKTHETQCCALVWGGGSGARCGRFCKPDLGFPFHCKGHGQKWEAGQGTGHDGHGLMAVNDDGSWNKNALHLGNFCDPETGDRCALPFRDDGQGDAPSTRDGKRPAWSELRAAAPKKAKKAKKAKKSKKGKKANKSKSPPADDSDSELDEDDLSLADVSETSSTASTPDVAMSDVNLRMRHQMLIQMLIQMIVISPP